MGDVVFDLRPILAPRGGLPPVDFLARITFAFFLTALVSLSSLESESGSARRLPLLEGTMMGSGLPHSPNLGRGEGLFALDDAAVAFGAVRWVGTNGSGFVQLPSLLSSMKPDAVWRLRDASPLRCARDWDSCSGCEGRCLGVLIIGDERRFVPFLPGGGW